MNQQQKNTIFNEISKRYRIVNRFISFGLDNYWRKKAANLVPLGKILDLGCGNGDFLKLLVNNKRDLLGLDPAIKMLEIAKQTVPSANFFCCTAEKIPLNDNAVDAVTISFGVRNFEKIDIALKEIHRVLQNDGELIILELREQRHNFLSTFSHFYIKNILPYIGKFLGKNFDAYNYLASSVINFSEKNLEKMLSENSFAIINNRYLFPGVCQIIHLKKLQKK